VGDAFFVERPTTLVFPFTSPLTSPSPLTYPSIWFQDSSSSPTKQPPPAWSSVSLLTYDAHVYFLLLISIAPSQPEVPSSTPKFTSGALSSG
jgi:hypothetical protein